VVAVNYSVQVTREDGVWLAQVAGLPAAHTFAKNLVSLERLVREVIALVEDLPDGAERSLALDWDFSQIGDEAIEAARLAVPLRDVDQERDALAARRVELVHAFAGKHWSVRDIASVLGVSPGRVTQIIHAS
jgi:predicted RNase H-like HicB family nuclease